MARRHQLVQRRKTVGLSQERLAEIMGVDRSTVVRWERADTDPQPWHRPRLAQTLGVSVNELAALLADISEVPPPPRPKRQAPVSLAPSWPSAPEIQPLFPAGNDLAAMRSLRVADRQIGGGYLYATVASYLQHNLAPRLFGSAPDSGGQPVFVAAAGLTEMAGWMAHDAGRNELASLHFQRALGMAETGQDQQVQAHILGSLSHLAHHTGQPDRAALYARQGRERLGNWQRHPGLKARLLAMKARTSAANCDSQRCARRLRDAERALSVVGEELSPWVSAFDEASFAAEAARCFSDLGQLNAARVQAERVIQLRSPERARSRAFAQLMLSSIAVAQGKVDEACTLGRDILAGTRALGSSLVLRQLEELRQSLLPYQRSRAVAAFLADLDDELQERHQPAQWLPPTTSASSLETP